MKIKSLTELKIYLQEDKYPQFDAEYSKQTISLVKKFEAVGADLNKWWVLTKPTWTCQYCKREKSDIVRKNKHGYLICHLHEHHDHMKDYVKKLFEEISSTKEIVLADSLSEKFSIRTSFALAAYDNTVICIDCNEADAIAKKEVKTHRSFSYSPDEINKFIVVNKNDKHIIDSKKALEIWENNKEIFSKRLELARYLAEIAASNLNWYQPSDVTAKQTELHAKNLFRSLGIDEIKPHNTEQLLYNTVVIKGEHNSWRIKNKNLYTPVLKPTDGEVNHMKAMRKANWTEVDDNWLCPSCLRTKFECIRKSNNNSWFFLVRNNVFMDFDSNNTVNSKFICNDCSVAASNLVQEAIKNAEIGIISSRSYIKLEEVKSMILVQPHNQHRINNDIADQLLPIITKRILEDYDTSD